MSSIQHILDKEKEAAEIIEQAKKTALEIKQKADEKQKNDLKEVSISLQKEKEAVIEHQKGDLVQRHKKITESGILKQKEILSKTEQNKEKAIRLILESLTK